MLYQYYKTFFNTHSALCKIVFTKYSYNAEDEVILYLLKQAKMQFTDSHPSLKRYTDVGLYNDMYKNYQIHILKKKN